VSFCAQALTNDVLSLTKLAQDINDRFTFNDTKTRLAEHTASFIDTYHFQTTTGKPTLKAHVALFQGTPLLLRQLENGRVLEVGHAFLWCTQPWHVACIAAPDITDCPHDCRHLS
jgi:hypothetical protein